jgi:adenosylcobinamide-phosphate synthase
VRGAVSVALATDWWFGEPSARWHPTVWMGAFLARARGHAGRGSTGRAYATTVLRDVAVGSAWVVSGVLLVCAVALVCSWIVGSLLTFTLARAVAPFGLPRGAGSTFREPLAALSHGALLKPAMAVRSLLDATHAVQAALAAPEHPGGLEEARRLLAWHLVSRPTENLRADEVAGAALASLAENFCDSIVAPLLAYRVAGLPGAFGYRFVNTADAMLGYRTAELAWFGKPAARLDDMCNLLPARMAAVALLVASVLCNESAAGAWRCMRQDARRTPSPNGGWPMAVMAGALGVVLDKQAVYTLNTAGRAPIGRDLARGRRLVLVATLLVVVSIELSYVD